jgi:hypothetical protein
MPEQLLDSCRAADYRIESEQAPSRHLQDLHFRVQTKLEMTIC